jgi:hypothetical protein
MIKVPTNNKYNVSSGPDLTPNIAYTRNVSFDEEGYIKQSHPLLRIYDDTQNADFGQVSDILNKGTYEYKIITDDKIFDLDLSDIALAVDAGAPTSADTTSRITGWGTDSYLINTGGDIYEYRASNNTWYQRNSDSSNFLSEFPSRATWVSESAGDVNQYATTELDDSPLSTTSTGPDLVLPRQFEVTGIAYSNYRVGIATKHDGQLQAMFFTWDGTSASANTGTPVDAPAILDVIAYKNSWVILTSRGQLLYFNGGGWDNLGDLPPYYFDAVWIDPSGSLQFGKILSTDGDLIYLNIGSQLEADEYDSGILPYFYSGVWCYDPKVGLYHRHTLSYSQVRRENLTPTAGIYTAASAHYLETGDKVMRSEDVYYAIKVDATTFKLATTYAKALAGTNDYTSASTFLWVERRDFGQLNWYNNVVGCVKFFDNAYTSQDGIMPFFAAGTLQKPDLTSDATLCTKFTKFDTISTILYSKYKSQEIEDIYNSIIVKFRPLVNSDKIIIKYKTEDTLKQRTIGEAGDASPDTAYITWTNDTTFTFPDAYMDASLVQVGDEVEIQSGVGAGQTAHVSSIALDSVWTVVLDEPIRGVVANNKSTIMFDNFKKLETITKDTIGAPKGQYTAKLNKPAKWIQVKIELRGSGITIEDMIINNITHKPII